MDEENPQDLGGQTKPVTQEEVDKAIGKEDAPNPYRELVDEWFAKHFQNNFLSQNVEIANANLAAKADLLDRLGKLK